jgi:Xaa-Pro aminopeptidase
MSAKIEFTAVEADGTTHTRSSGTMPYVAVTVGSQVQWHKSMEAAQQAAVSRTQTWKTGVPATIIPATPTAIKGKLGDWTPHIDGWGEIAPEAFAELVAAKSAPKGKKAQAELPIEEPAEDPTPVVVEGPAEVTEEPAPVKATKPVKTTTERSLKQQLGRAVVDAAFAAALANVPEGMTEAEAKEIVTKWMSYIPVPKEA